MTASASFGSTRVSYRFVRHPDSAAAEADYEVGAPPRASRVRSDGSVALGAARIEIDLRCTTQVRAQTTTPEGNRRSGALAVEPAARYTASFQNIMFVFAA